MRLTRGDLFVLTERAVHGKGQPNTATMNVKGHKLTKPALGSKHLCLACGVKFYDLKRVPAACPSCGTNVKKSNGLANRNTTPKKPEVSGPVKAATEDSDIEATNDTQVLANTDDIEENDNNITGLIKGGLAQED